MHSCHSELLGGLDINSKHEQSQMTAREREAVGDRAEK